MSVGAVVPPSEGAAAEGDPDVGAGGAGLVVPARDGGHDHEGDEQREHDHDAGADDDEASAGSGGGRVGGRLVVRRHGGSSFGWARPAGRRRGPGPLLACQHSGPPAPDPSVRSPSPSPEATARGRPRVRTAMTTTTPTTTRPTGSAASSRRPRASSIGVPLALGLVGTVVALVGSSTVSLWTDEAATVSAAPRRCPSSGPWSSASTRCTPPTTS